MTLKYRFFPKSVQECEAAQLMAFSLGYHWSSAGDRQVIEFSDAKCLYFCPKNKEITYGYGTEPDENVPLTRRYVNNIGFNDLGKLLEQLKNPPKEVIKQFVSVIGSVTVSSRNGISIGGNNMTREEFQKLFSSILKEHQQVVSQDDLAKE